MTTPKHVNGSNCPACAMKLLQTDLKLRIWFVSHVLPQFPDFHVAISYRNEADQNEAYVEHKSDLKFPFSKHNHMDSLGKPCSKAIDLFQLFGDGTAAFPIPAYQKLAVGLPDTMRWGGTFTDLRDYDHFELL